MNGLSQPPPFAASSARGSASTAWSTWKKSFGYYVQASKIDDGDVKRATLLHCAGLEVQQIFDTLPDTGTTYEHALQALTTHFEPQTNAAYQRHVFRQCVQENKETVDEFYIRLRSSSSTCAFGEQQDEHIRDQFIDKCISKPLRRRLLRESNLTLTTLLSIARAAEAADNQALSIEQSNASPHPAVNEIRARRPPTQPPAARRDYPRSWTNSRNPGRSIPAPGREYHRPKRDQYHKPKQDQ